MSSVEAVGVGRTGRTSCAPMASAPSRCSPANYAAICCCCCSRGCRLGRRRRRQGGADHRRDHDDEHRPEFLQRVSLGEGGRGACTPRSATTPSSIATEQPAEVDVSSLVPGDVVHLRVGDVVPADLRLLESHGLECDESVLTGEAQAAAKTTARPARRVVARPAHCAFMGTIVRAGTGGAWFAPARTPRSAESR